MKKQCMTFCLGMLAAVLAPISSAAPLASGVTADNRGFVQTNGQPWKRVSLKTPATDSPYAYLEARFECPGNSKQVFLDELSISLIHKSSDLPDAYPNLFMSTDFQSSSLDWQNWNGSSKVIIQTERGSLETELPIHSLDVVSAAKEDESLVGSVLRLNPLPAMPREVSVHSGAAKALAKSFAKSLSQAIGSPSALPSTLTVQVLSGGGLPISLAFNLSGFERNLALAIHQQCKNP